MQYYYLKCFHLTCFSAFPSAEVRECSVVIVRFIHKTSSSKNCSKSYSVFSGFFGPLSSLKTFQPFMILHIFGWISHCLIFLITRKFWETWECGSYFASPQAVELFQCPFLNFIFIPFSSVSASSSNENPSKASSFLSLSWSNSPKINVGFHALTPHRNEKLP